jgi:DNA-binding transcriptional MerR regulator
MEQVTTRAQVRIGELAREFGLNPKTLRYYEEIGLLPPPERAENGYRLYDDANRQRLRFISQAKAVGLTLEEISQILALQGAGTPPCEHVLGILDHKLQAVDEQLRTLTNFRAELVTLREEARKTMRTDACVCGIIEQHTARHREEQTRD